MCEFLVPDSVDSHLHAYEIRKERWLTQLVICKQNDLIDHAVLWWDCPGSRKSYTIAVYGGNPYQNMNLSQHVIL